MVYDFKSNSALCRESSATRLSTWISFMASFSVYVRRLLNTRVSFIVLFSILVF